jgi:Protein of unknown function (DUF3263).
MDTAPVPGGSDARDDAARHEAPRETRPDTPREAHEPGRRSPAPASGELSERERRLLAFERQWFRYAGAKEQAIKETFDISATRYYQLLAELIERPEAMAFDPMLVKRLRRLRAARQRERAARRLGTARDRDRTWK